MVVLVDSSDDFRSEEFRSEIAFALDLLNIFWGNNTRMGFYTFGGATKQHFALDTHTDLNDLKSAINSIPYSNGNGESLEDAMMHVVENAFSATAGGRLCIPNVLVILTHTGFSSTSDVASLQRAIRAHGVNLVVIDLVKGVGDHGFGDLDDKITVIYKYNDISNLQDSSAVLFDYTKRCELTFEPRREKTGFLHMQKQRPDQLRGNREVDQHLCFHYIGSTILLLPKYEISRL